RHVMVEASVGSSDPIWLVVDTGAGSTLIDSQVATALHLELNGRVTVGGAGAGTQTGSFVRGAQYQFANKAIAPQKISLALPLAQMAPLLGHKVAGILGYDFLSRYVTEIDYAGQVMRLYPKAEFEYKGSGEELPMTLKMNHPHV